MLWGDWGTDADMVAAVDKAISDGVDILSVSIWNTWEWQTMASPVSIAYMNAGASTQQLSCASKRFSCSG